LYIGVLRRPCGNESLRSTLHRFISGSAQIALHQVSMQLTPASNRGIGADQGHPALQNRGQLMQYWGCGPVCIRGHRGQAMGGFIYSLRCDSCTRGGVAAADAGRLR
jgi:hypothetical protein